LTKARRAELHRKLDKILDSGDAMTRLFVAQNIDGSYLWISDRPAWLRRHAAPLKKRQDELEELLDSASPE